MTVKTLLYAVAYVGVAVPALWFGTWRRTLRESKRPPSGDG